MLKELESYTALPESVRQVALALSIIVDRFRSLPKSDRDEMFELLMELKNTDDDEEKRGIQRAMEEILAQIPIGVRSMPLDHRPMTRGLHAWAQHVGQTIKRLREQANMTQIELAEKAGLTQSHVSRIENAEHSPTHFTLDKIAKALSVEIRELDPVVD